MHGFIFVAISTSIIIDTILVVVTTRAVSSTGIFDDAGLVCLVRFQPVTRVTK